MRNPSDLFRGIVPAAIAGGELEVVVIRTTEKGRAFLDEKEVADLDNMMGVKRGNNEGIQDWVWTRSKKVATEVS